MHTIGFRRAVAGAALAVAIAGASFSAVLFSGSDSSPAHKVASTRARACDHFDNDDVDHVDDHHDEHHHDHDASAAELRARAGTPARAPGCPAGSAGSAGRPFL